MCKKAEHNGHTILRGAKIHFLDPKKNSKNSVPNGCIGPDEPKKQPTK